MIKVLFRLAVVIVVAAVISWLITGCVQKYNPDLITNAVTTWAAIWQAIAAVGAILMVVYGEDVKSSMHKPNVAIRVNRNSPLSCKVGRKDPKEDKDTSNVMEIYAEVMNSGVATAESCQVVADCVLASAENNNYTIQSEFCQTPFGFIPDGKTEVKLPQSIKRYLLCGSIVENVSEPTTVGGVSSTTKRAELRIALNDRSSAVGYVKIDSRMYHVLVPISIVSAGCNAIRKVLHIYWGGSSVSECTNPSLYNVEIKDPGVFVNLLDTSVNKTKIGV